MKLLENKYIDEMFIVEGFIIEVDCVMETREEELWKIIMRLIISPCKNKIKNIKKD